MEGYKNRAYLHTAWVASPIPGYQVGSHLKQRGCPAAQSSTNDKETGVYNPLGRAYAVDGTNDLAMTESGGLRM